MPAPLLICDSSSMERKPTGGEPRHRTVPFPFSFHFVSNQIPFFAGGFVYGLFIAISTSRDVQYVLLLALEEGGAWKKAGGSPVRPSKFVVPCLPALDSNQLQAPVRLLFCAQGSPRQHTPCSGGTPAVLNVLFTFFSHFPFPCSGTVAAVAGVFVCQREREREWFRNGMETELLFCGRRAPVMCNFYVLPLVQGAE